MPRRDHSSVYIERNPSLWEAIGDRRSIRYFQAYRPVERWKIEVMFQAAHRSSRAVNASFIKAVGIERDRLDPDILEALKTPTNTADLDMAPFYIFTYADPTAPAGGASRLKDLYNRGAFAPALGWSHAYIDNVVDATVLQEILKDDVGATLLAGEEASQAVAHMLLAATALGLGTCCKSFGIDAAKEALNVPDHLVPLWMILVGYPAEDPRAGGQRPRPPLGEDYFWGSFDQPFETSEEVTDLLWDLKMLQPEAPYSWRQAEIRAIARSYGLPE